MDKLNMFTKEVNSKAYFHLLCHTQTRLHSSQRKALSTLLHRVLYSSVLTLDRYLGMLEEMPDDTSEAIGWIVANQKDHPFILPDGLQSEDIVCRHGAIPAPAHLTVAAGETITLQWTDWDITHAGPIISYLGDCNGPCETVNKNDLRFFKFEEMGLLGGVENEYGVPRYASDVLRDNDEKWDVKIPEYVAPGNYVLRNEIIALHNAQDKNGAQLYPQCINLVVTGAGTVKPPGVPATQLYNFDDPGLNIDVRKSDGPYSIPGPAVFDPSSSGGAASSGTSTNTSPASNNLVSSQSSSTTSSAVASSSSSSTSSTSTAPSGESTSTPSPSPSSSSTSTSASNPNVGDTCAASTVTQTVTVTVNAVSLLSLSLSPFHILVFLPLFFPSSSLSSIHSYNFSSSSLRQIESSLSFHLLPRIPLICVVIYRGNLSQPKPASRPRHLLLKKWSRSQSRAMNHRHRLRQRKRRGDHTVIDVSDIDEE